MNYKQQGLTIINTLIVGLTKHHNKFTKSYMAEFFGERKWFTRLDKTLKRTC